MTTTHPPTPRRILDDHLLRIAAALRAVAAEWEITSDILEPGSACRTVLPLVAHLQRLPGRDGGLDLEQLLLAAQAVDNEAHQIARSLEAAEWRKK